MYFVIGMAYAKCQITAGNFLPHQGFVYLSVNDKDKHFNNTFVQKLLDLVFKLFATGRTAETLNS